MEVFSCLGSSTLVESTMLDLFLLGNNRDTLKLIEVYLARNHMQGRLKVVKGSRCAILLPDASRPEVVSFHFFDVKTKIKTSDINGLPRVELQVKAKGVLEEFRGLRQEVYACGSQRAQMGYCRPN